MDRRKGRGEELSGILDSIHQPADLKDLSSSQLKQLAEEIREELVTVVGTNGGHLASNLGVVELTIALHRVFDAPKDKIVWDTGHQSYVHKLLTGRRERFATLRQHGGLSGFTDRGESPYDVFGAGHAGTSISAALGIAISRDLAGEDYHVVAVIGDGALTAGMAQEALNQAGHLSTRLIVVLNDNGMAISPNVGVLSRWLSRVRLDPHYHRAEGEVEEVITRFPLGTQVLKTGRRAKEGVKSLLLPTMILEEIGFTYIGPFNGHNIAELEEALRQAQGYRYRPTFVHVITKKGKGYKPAEEDAVNFHGVAPAKSKSSAPTYSQVFGQTLLHLFRKNPRIVAITAAMQEGTGLGVVAREFPHRVFDVGICEQHAVTFAAGLATQGFIPIVAIYSTFFQRALDQVLHDVCLQNLPVVFAIDRSGIVGDDGKTHQGCFDLSYLGCIPNLVICAPRDERKLQDLLYTAVRAGCPMAIRYPRGSVPGGELGTKLREIPIGKGELLRNGEDVALLAIGATVVPSLKAAEELSQKGIECTVIDARFAKPLDLELILDTANRIKRFVTIEENSLLGGFGSAVLQLLYREGIHDIQVKCLGIPDEFVEHGLQGFLRSKYRLDDQGIAHQVLAFFPELAYTLPQGKKIDA
jgi:1-deoxy-D-xylulose-5-phosphate synthase